MQTRTKFIFDCVKLIEYIASAVNAASPNPCVGLFIGIKMSFPFIINMNR